MRREIPRFRCRRPNQNTVQVRLRLGASSCHEPDPQRSTSCIVDGLQAQGSIVIAKQHSTFLH